jgi:N-acetylglucosamine-6-phosphate deacetylase
MSKTVVVDGNEIEVSEEIYKAIIDSDNPEKYYISSTKGKILLKDMADEHLKNAFLKCLRNKVQERFEQLKNYSIEEITKEGLVTLVIAKDSTIQRLFDEMESRTKKTRDFGEFFTDFLSAGQENLTTSFKF